MFFQKEPKSLRIIILIIAACLVAGAALLIYSGKKPPLPKEEKVPAGIEVIETETGKIVRNKAEGYEVTVPKEWRIENTKETKRQAFHSPETLEQEVPGQIEYGCKIETYVSPEKTTLEKLQQDTKEELEWYTVKKNEYSIIDVSGYKAVKNIFESEEMGYSIGVYIPTETKLFSFIMYPAEKDLEKCIQYFDNFLKTIVIK